MRCTPRCARWASSRGWTASCPTVREALPQVINTPEVRFDCDDTRKFAVIEEVAARLRAEGAKVSETDGVRVLTDDGWWLLRASNTQAVLVARAEATTEAGLERLKAALVRAACRVRPAGAGFFRKPRGALTCHCELVTGRWPTRAE